jgi:hypothetical protein
MSYISSSAVLISLNISCWPASKVDREATDKVNTDANAVSSAGQVRKDLFAGTSLRKDIERKAARIRNYFSSSTLPWADKGERMLPMPLFMDVKQTIAREKREYDEMCEMFFDAYPQLVVDAPSRLGKFYKAEDYPDIEEVRSKFGFRYTITPMPEAGDFRLDVANEELAELKAQYETAYQQRLADAMRDPWERLHDMLKGMSEKLADSGDKTKRFHDSFVSNPIELCTLLTKLNVTNDPKLEEARRHLEAAMVGADIEAIKEAPEVRADMKSKVDAILGKFDW